MTTLLHPRISPEAAAGAVRREAEGRLTRVSSQVALVRALIDHAEVLARSADTVWLDAQLVEEMVRLGYRMIEAAASLSSLPEASSRDSA